jgi:hypothetical protein
MWLAADPITSQRNSIIKKAELLPPALTIGGGGGRRGSAGNDLIHGQEDYGETVSAIIT